MSAIKNISAAIIDTAVQLRERDGNFLSLVDFCERMRGKGINRKTVECLIKSGALGHPEVLFLKKGTYDDYREMLRQRGANLNQVKPLKVIDTDEKRDFFFSHIED